MIRVPRPARSPLQENDHVERRKLRDQGCRSCTSSRRASILVHDFTWCAAPPHDAASAKLSGLHCRSSPISPLAGGRGRHDGGDGVDRRVLGACIRDTQRSWHHCHSRQCAGRQGSIGPQDGRQRRSVAAEAYMPAGYCVQAFDLVATSPHCEPTFGFANGISIVRLRICSTCRKH